MHARALPKLISICGIDGSGKTTQLLFLRNCLARRKIKLKHVWFRWPAFISFPFLALCRLVGYTEWKTVRANNAIYADRMFYKNKAIAKLWPSLFAIDALIHSVVHISIPAKLGYHLLCDRYILDILVDLMYDTKNSDLPERISGKLLLALIPNRSITLLIDVNEQTAHNRKSDQPSIKTLKEKRRLYLKLAHALNIPVLDGEEKPEEIHQEVIERLGQHMQAKGACTMRSAHEPVVLAAR